MRSKVRTFLDKEEGFTLVELLAVIVILGIIVAIAIPAIGSVIDRADTNTDEAEIVLIEDAARLYVTTNVNEPNKLSWSPQSGKTETRIKVQDLIDEGYLENRDLEKELKGAVEVKREEITENGIGTGNYKYSYNYSEPVTTEIR